MKQKSLSMDQAPYNSSAKKDQQAGSAKADLVKADIAKAEPIKKSAKTASVTPMMAQFLEIKAINPGFILFYRMGDFYELFFEDAKIASHALGIALTTRGSHLGEEIPMCGVPVRAHQQYLQKLISLGHRVAICEQMETPIEAKKRGSKSVVRRDVVRLVTPGTITEDDLLAQANNNYLGALAMLSHGEADFALAWADISTGETFVSDISANRLEDELGRLDLAELILSEKTAQYIDAKKLLPPTSIRHQAIFEAHHFQSENAIEQLREAFPSIDISDFSRVSCSALGGLLAYVSKTQKASGIALRAPLLAKNDGRMSIDLATWSSLEVLSTNRGEVKGSLRHAIDKTLTGAGSRLLSRRLTAPLADVAQIKKRLDMLEILVDDSLFRQQLFKSLSGMPDIGRPLTRLCLGRGGPRDLLHIAHAINGGKNVLTLLEEKLELPQGFADQVAILQKTPQDLASEIIATIIERPPLLAREGGFVAQNCNAELDLQRELTTKSRTYISQLQAELAKKCDIKSLKIKHNNVIGFFVEVPASHGQKLLDHPFNEEFIHRQTMANAMRFSTRELSELQGQIASAQQNALEIEMGIFERLLQKTVAATQTLRECADALAKIDLTYGLAVLAAEKSYCRPKIDNSLQFEIKDGRHPVVEQTLGNSGQTFVTNDCDLSGIGQDKANGGQLWLVTGPNMGGKSTFLRQNGLIAIMAQIGSFVPASFAHIGIVDRLFSRVGASDDIARGRSTFMVEMVETAAILNRATKRSLVVLDEIGRGTATFDGLSIAWAAAEALHNTNACRALFATHFHELTSLPAKLPRVSNHTMKAREWQGKVVFLHEVTAGAADRSYGIQVAQLAGLPEAVLQRAREILHMLENQEGGAKVKLLDDLPLFTHQPKYTNQTALGEKPNDLVDKMIKNILPDELTPLQAIEFIYQLKKTHNSERSGEQDND